VKQVLERITFIVDFNVLLKSKILLLPSWVKLTLRLQTSLVVWKSKWPWILPWSQKVFKL